MGALWRRLVEWWNKPLFSDLFERDRQFTAAHRQALREYREQLVARAAAGSPTAAHALQNEERARHERLHQLD